MKTYWYGLALAFSIPIAFAQVTIIDTLSPSQKQIANAAYHWVKQSMQLTQTIMTHQATPIAAKPYVAATVTTLPHTMTCQPLIFISFSMPRHSILQWLQQAKALHGIVVIRGLVHNSFKATLQALQPLLSDATAGIQIDPILFERFGITQVPAVVLTSVPFARDKATAPYAVIYGDVPLQDALAVLTAHTPLCTLALPT